MVCKVSRFITPHILLLVFFILSRQLTILFFVRQLQDEVCRMANVLRASGVRKGDRVALYLPVSPLAVVAMLACARIGAVHSVVFAGFSAEALAARIQDGEWVDVPLCCFTFSLFLQLTLLFLLFVIPIYCCLLKYEKKIAHLQQPEPRQ